MMSEPMTDEDRELLYSQLQNKLAGSPESQAPLIDAQSRSADQVNRNALYQALAQGSAQAGSIGGRMASAEPVSTAVRGANQAGAMGVQEVEQQTKRGDVDRDQLMRYLKQQSDVAFSKNKQKTEQENFKTKEKREADALAETTRHNQQMEKNASEKTSTLLTARDDKKSLSGNKDSMKRFDDLTKSIKGSVRDSIGDEDRKLRVATHGASLLDQNKPLSQFSPLEVQEISGVLASQVASGSPAESTLRHMTPQTMASDLSKAYSYITGKPSPANQGEYLDLFRHMLKRQIETSQNIIKSKISPIIANYRDLSEKDPEKYKNILAGAGLKTDDVGQLLSYEPDFLQKINLDVPVNAPASGTAVAAPAADAKPKQSAKTMPIGTTKVINGTTYEKVEGGWREVTAP